MKIRTGEQNSTFTSKIAFAKIYLLLDLDVNCKMLRNSVHAAHGTVYSMYEQNPLYTVLYIFWFFRILINLVNNLLGSR